ncbi:hypothetical protein UJ101_01393 [Flavobacteriaceae bacterium UJ101]|nr:hypothetical protein UJ101_01393 [Flavobacteriaceae bacterium UJ101]
MGILPNFLGALLFCITLSFIPNLTRKSIVVMTIGLVIFMEIERYFNQNISFDISDIAASVVAILLWWFLTKSKILDNFF